MSKFTMKLLNFHPEKHLSDLDPFAVQAVVNFDWHSRLLLYSFEATKPALENSNKK